MLPQVGEVAEIEVENFATIPSFDMSVQFAFGLATAYQRSARARPMCTASWSRTARTRWRRPVTSRICCCSPTSRRCSPARSAPTTIRSPTVLPIC